MKPKLGKQKVTVIEGEKKKSSSLSAFEDFNHLAGFAQIELKGRSVGAAILQRSKNRFCFVFGFSSYGIHDTLRPDQIPPTISNFESALKELLPGERMTVHLSSFAEDADRQKELDALLAKAPSPELRLLLMSEKARTQELKRSGVRKPKKLHIFVTYTVEPNEQTTNESDWIEKAIAKCSGLWEVFKGAGDDIVVEQTRTMLERSFTEGYLRWEQLLNIKMGLDIKPMSSRDLWANLWHRFNYSKAPEIPQYLHLTEQGLKEVINTDIHPTTVLVQGEYGQSTVPKADRRWIKIKGRYVGALSFTAKPVGFANAREQLRYLWNILCRPHVVDTEIICQITGAKGHSKKKVCQCSSCGPGDVHKPLAEVREPFLVSVRESLDLLFHLDHRFLSQLDPSLIGLRHQGDHWRSSSPAHRSGKAHHGVNLIEDAAVPVLL